MSRWDNAVPARNKRVRRGCLIRQAVWLVGSSANEFRRGSPHQTTLSGSLGNVPTSFGKVRLIRQAVWLVGASANEFRQVASSDRLSGLLVVPTSVGRLPHQTGSLGVCVRDVPSGVARGVALWTSCVSGVAPPAVSAGGAELRGAATVESLPPPAGSLAPARRLRMAEGGGRPNVTNPASS